MAKNINILAKAVDENNARLRGAKAQRDARRKADGPSAAATAAQQQDDQAAGPRAYQAGRRLNAPQRQQAKATNLEVLRNAVARTKERRPAR
jgi:hypothetical protein